MGSLDISKNCTLPIESRYAPSLTRRYVIPAELETVFAAPLGVETAVGRA